MPHLEKAEFNVEVQSLGENSQPVVITQSEYMRRMKQISQFQPGMSFYQQMPDSYTLVLNSDHSLVKKVLDNCNNKISNALKPILSELKGLQARLTALHQSQSSKKPEEVTKEEKDDLARFGSYCDSSHIQERMTDIRRELYRLPEMNAYLESYSELNKMLDEITDIVINSGELNLDIIKKIRNKCSS